MTMPKRPDPAAGVGVEVDADATLLPNLCPSSTCSGLEDDPPTASFSVIAAVAAVVGGGSGDVAAGGDDDDEMGVEDATLLGDPGPSCTCSATGSRSGVDDPPRPALAAIDSDASSSESSTIAKLQVRFFLGTGLGTTASVWVRVRV